MGEKLKIKQIPNKLKKNIPLKNNNKNKKKFYQIKRFLKIFLFNSNPKKFLKNSKNLSIKKILTKIKKLSKKKKILKE